MEESHKIPSKIWQLCNKTLIKEMMDQLDKTATKQVKRDVRRTERRNWGASKVDVAEIYSPPRMTAMAHSLGQKAGSAMDLTTVDEDGMPWDFSVTSNQKKAMKILEEERPWLLVVSPPCTMFSTLQNLTLEKRDADEVRKQLKEAVKHLTFAVYLRRLMASVL